MNDNFGRGRNPRRLWLRWTAAEGGRFVIPAGDNPRSPRFQAAQRTCQSLMPAQQGQP